MFPLINLWAINTSQKCREIFIILLSKIHNVYKTFGKSYQTFLRNYPITHVRVSVKSKGYST